MKYGHVALLLQSCSLEQSGNYPETTGSTDYDGMNNSSSRSGQWGSEIDEMDGWLNHCIEIDTNLRMQKEYIKNVKLTFKDPKMEDEVSILHFTKSLNCLYKRLSGFSGILEG